MKSKFYALLRGTLGKAVEGSRVSIELWRSGEGKIRPCPIFILADVYIVRVHTELLRCESPFRSFSARCDNGRKD